MDEKKNKQIPTKRLIIGGIALLLAITGWLLSVYCEGFSDLYGFNLYPVLVNVFARISNIFPFSVAEMICSRVLSPGAIKVLVMRDSGQKR